MSLDAISSPEVTDVAGAISAVLGDFSGYVQKDGRITKGGNYSFASEVAFIDTLRPLVVKHGLIVQMIDMVPEVSTFTTKYGAQMNVTRVRVVYRIVHAASGQWLRFVTLGEGMDTGDKSGNKAMTGAYKYLWRQMGIVATGDDPDRSRPEHEEPRREPQRREPPRQQRPTAPTPADRALNYTVELLEESGVQSDDDANLVSVHYSPSGQPWTAILDKPPEVAGLTKALETERKQMAGSLAGLVKSLRAKEQ